MGKLLGVITSLQRPGRREDWFHPRFSLLNKIWNEEVISQDWKLGLLVKLPKKGDLSLSKNWRGIMLLSVASKVHCKIILERMKDSLDDRLRDGQAGFSQREILL